MGPDVGKKDVMSGVGDAEEVQVKSIADVAVVLCSSTVILPVVAPWGTITVICVVDALTTSAYMPSNVMW